MAGNTRSRLSCNIMNNESAGNFLVEGKSMRKIPVFAVKINLLKLDYFFFCRLDKKVRKFYRLNMINILLCGYTRKLFLTYNGFFVIRKENGPIAFTCSIHQ